jgi:hypothetical protein
MHGDFFAGLFWAMRRSLDVSGRRFSLQGVGRLVLTALRPYFSFAKPTALEEAPPWPAASRR